MFGGATHVACLIQREKDGVEVIVAGSVHGDSVAWFGLWCKKDVFATFLFPLVIKSDHGGVGCGIEITWWVCDNCGSENRTRRGIC